MDPLRIGIIAPPWFSVPPSGYGGIELVVSYLADGLADRGHDVTLFAAGGSTTKARLCSVFAEPPSLELGNPVFEARHLAHAYKHWPQFDIIHDHTLTGLCAGAAVPIPVVHTMHGPITPEVADLYAQARDAVHFIAISESQASTAPAGTASRVIHNGVRLRDFPFSATAGDYLLFVGRIHPDKGVLEAIEIARQSNMRLVIVCKKNEPAERAYWEGTVLPALAGLSVEVHEQPPQQVKLRLYRDAFATLFPIQWPEPFGLVMIESMATGTPVLAFSNGSVNEVVANGTTGFIVHNVQEAVDALPLIATIDRRTCRAHVQCHFSEEQNVLSTERLYQDILAGCPQVGPVLPDFAISPADFAAPPVGRHVAPAHAYSAGPRSTVQLTNSAPKQSESSGSEVDLVQGVV